MNFPIPVMEREGSKRRIRILCQILAAVTVLGISMPLKATAAETVQTTSDNTNINKCDGEENFNNKRSLLLVSTLDGKVSALNLEKEGELEWFVDAGAMPLLSSTISKLEVLRDGKPTRLVPSLDGSLFQFDGDSIEALPFTADTLLSSSFNLNHDSTIVGGKETITYGVELRTGKIRYACTMSGCSKFDGEGSTDTEDVLVLTRHTKTVRAVEMRTGLEKWNFSVGQHEVSMVPTSDSVRHIGSENKDMPKDGGKSAQSCNGDTVYEEDEDWLDFLGQSWFTDENDLLNDIDLKVIVPHGLVVAMSRLEPDKVLWKYKFKSPIANAWRVNNRELSDVSLFDDRNVPALQEDLDEEETLPGGPAEPMLYIGIHEKQVYVQPSVRLTDEVRGTVSGPTNKALAMPRVRWHPYIATAPSRTPAVSSYNPIQLTFEEKVEESGLAVWQNQYPFDNGWYLMSDTSPVNLTPVDTDDNSTMTLYIEIAGSLWNWWREVLAISIITSVVMNMIIVKFFHRKQIIYEVSGSISKESNEGIMEGTSQAELLHNESSSSLEIGEVVRPEYVSRYLTEFESKQCLGKGGFGVVFEAVNKMDDCSYAMKRISLNNSERAREKVMREVKALAKLEHIGIVRYYQAWFENPPAGWQEKQDTVYLDIPSATPTPIYSETGHESHFTKDIISNRPPKEPDILEEDSENYVKNSPSEALLGGGDAGNPLKVFGGLDRWENTGDTFSDFSNSDNQNKNGSGGFLPELECNDLEESGSYSIGFGTPKQKGFLEDSCTVLFDLGGDDDSKPYVEELPFTDYKNGIISHNPNDEDTNDSFNIVFEDSGCNEDPSRDNSIDKAKYISESENTHSEYNSHSNIKRSSTVPVTNNRVSTSGLVRPNSLNLVNRPHRTSTHDDPKSWIDPAAPKLYLYIQMQLCQRESLKDWLNDNTITRDRKEVLDIFDQIVCAVDYIHDSGLMHRDLKPSNIFFSMDGTVKVGDFGLVTTLEEASSSVAHTPFGGLNHTSQVGTKLYMSPEQASGRSYNHKVDIYALGLIFFELFSPFATQMERVKTLIEVKRGIFPRCFDQTMHDECKFVGSMLDLRPERRPSTKEVQQNPLLQDFEAARQSISRIRPRTRTTSSSGSATSLSSS